MTLIMKIDCCLCRLFLVFFLAASLGSILSFRKIYHDKKSRFSYMKIAFLH